MAQDKRDCTPIPGPKGLPFVGNIFDIAGEEVPIQALAQMGNHYGEIFTLRILGQRQMFISSRRLLEELCNERRFDKAVIAELAQMRNVAHDGLFTAYTFEKNWEIAHRVLVPAFGPLKIRGMFDPMKDIASQLVLKWVRHGPSHRIAVSDDFTRLTLDTLALCAMSFRFNSFYSEQMHPFVSAMMFVLKYGEQRANRPALFRAFSRRDEKQWLQETNYMRGLSRDLIEERRKNPKESDDLMDAMITGRDPKTGQNLSDDSIIDNMITFLVAGHETTSGALSFAFYYLLKHPEVLKRAQQEVDEVIGEQGVQHAHLARLPYITAILRETLRLQSTAPGFSFTPKNGQAEVLAGKYRIEHGEAVHAILHNVHRDPAVYGEDSEDFKPERMLDEPFNALPPCSWKPFGNGARGCIGCPFAWQEMMLVLAMLLRYFDFTLDDPAYTLRIVSSLTIKPKDFFMKATPRKGWTADLIEKDILSVISKLSPELQDHGTYSKTEDPSPSKHPLNILYGSNSGTCEALARALAADAAGHGFQVSRVDTLDAAKQNLPKDEPIVVITASYEGQPCDNAAQFFDWLHQSKSTQDISNKFAVFGCGHSDWVNTFHRIPKNIDDLLERKGGRRVCEMGSADAANGDMLSEFQTWEDRSLWPALKASFGDLGTSQLSVTSTPGPSIVVELVNGRAATLRPDVSQARVVAARPLSGSGVPEKRHIELQLPSGMTYRAGDYCAVLPMNPSEKVHAVMTRFGLPADAMLKISATAGTLLPTKHPIPAQSLFSSYLELAQPATKRDIGMLAEASHDPETKTELLALRDGDFASRVTQKRLSLLDLLQQFPSTRLSLGMFIGSLMTMRVRQYSISSSSLVAPDIASLTYSVLHQPATSGQERHVGVASNYLQSLEAGDIVHVTVKPSSESFHLPVGAEQIPVVMIATGAGIAPFRGFIQERAAIMKSGTNLAPSYLYYGCHHPEKDDLYRDELDAWESAGAVTVRRAYSRAPERSQGKRHIDEVILTDKAALLQVWKQGAKVYVCGSRGLGESVKRAILHIATESAREEGEDDSDAAVNDWFNAIHDERYATDVFD